MSDFGQINELIKKSKRGETTVKEETILLDWIHADPKNMAFIAKGKDLERLIQQWVEYEKMSTEDAEHKLWERWINEKNS